MDIGLTVRGQIGKAYSGLADVLLVKRNDCKDIDVAVVVPIDKADYDQVKREVWFLKWLSHSNIITMKQTFCKDSKVIIIKPFYDMCSVLRVIHTSYQYGFPEKAIAMIVKGLLVGLRYLHEQKIVHRSIKCSHIYLDTHDGVKLGGLRHCAFLKDNGLTGAQNVLHGFDAELSSEILWLAPEILKQDLYGYGLLSDVYSVGITLCEMGNGFPPFSDMDGLQMLYEKSKGTTPRLLDCTTLPRDDDTIPEQKNRRFSDSFHDFVEICLKPLPEDRWPVSKLVAHPFIKNLKKSRSIADVLPKWQPVQIDGEVSDGLFFSLLLFITA
uniref:Protein kinase domain-containing protein n=1 Tax=Syphacia muris TaxID=451379 RepID=A0A0N5AMT3_9BILA